MKMLRVRAAAALAFALAAPACDGAPTTTEPASLRGDWGADPVTVTVPIPSGARPMNALESWTFNADGTYHRQRLLADGSAVYPEYVQDGTWSAADGIVELTATHAYQADYANLSQVATMQPVSGITQRFAFTVAERVSLARVLSVTYICGPTENCIDPIPALVLREMMMHF
jgi:hypothetical protein